MPTISVATKANRAGIFEGVYKVPAGRTGIITLQTNADAVDLENESKGLTFSIFVSDDGIQWPEKPRYSCIYLGGIHYKSVMGELVRYAASPGLIFDISKVAGKFVKVRVELTGVWNIGINAVV